MELNSFHFSPDLVDPEKIQKELEEAAMEQHVLAPEIEKVPLK